MKIFQTKVFTELYTNQIKEFSFKKLRSNHRTELGKYYLEHVLSRIRNEITSIKSLSEGYLSRIIY